MNPKKIPQISEEFLQQIEKSNKEFSETRNNSWLKAKKWIEQLLDDSNFTKDPSVRTTLFALHKAAWFQGYNQGTNDTSLYVMQEMGLGSVVDLTEFILNLQQQLNQSKPENN